MGKNAMEVFQAEAPEVSAAFMNLVGALSSAGGLDAKTKQLVYIAMRAAEGDVGAVVAHTPMAKQAGATWEELKDAILMSLTVSGIKGVVSCLPEALEAYERNPRTMKGWSKK
jgi:AhpD family alkylhydroperoxidase